MVRRTYLLAGLVPALAFVAVGSLGLLNLFLPALPVTLFLFALPNWLGIVVGGLVNYLLFAVANAYIPLVLRRNYLAKWLWLPSLGALLVLLALTGWFYATGLHYAMEYQGITFFKLNALAALWGFGIAVLWLRRIGRGAGGEDVAKTGRRSVWFNAYLQTLFLIVAFPYFGELP